MPSRRSLLRIMDGRAKSMNEVENKIVKMFGCACPSCYKRNERSDYYYQDCIAPAKAALLDAVHAAAGKCTC